MQIVGVQLDVAWEDREPNHARVRKLLGATPPAPGALVVLPEMFATGFSMNSDITAAHGAATERFVRELSKQLGVFVIAGLVQRSEDGTCHNAAIVTNPSGSIIASVAKLHMFPLSGEGGCHTRGEDVIVVDCDGASVAPLVCYDLRFPEAFGRATRKGATLFTIIANWPASREEHWVTLLRARAIENQAFVIGVNRVGRDPNTLYGGRSMVIDPLGTVLAEADDTETLLTAQVDLSLVTETRNKFPFLNDMRDDLR